MKVFLSWSGPISRQVAVTLRDWLPKVIQAIEPWMSAEDIGKGARWSPEIAQKLLATKAGIICVTPENQNSAWLNFEAGALSKTVENATMVCPLLFGIKNADITGPLAQFQTTETNKEDVKRLISTLNKAISNPLEDGKLAEAFDVWWEKLDQAIKGISLSSSVGVPKRGVEEMIEELLTTSREQSRTIDILGQFVNSLAQHLQMNNLYATQNLQGLLPHQFDSSPYRIRTPSSTDYALYGGEPYIDSAGSNTPLEEMLGISQDSLRDTNPTPVPRRKPIGTPSKKKKES